MAKTRTCSGEKGASDDDVGPFNWDSRAGGKSSSRRPKRLPIPMYMYMEKQDVQRYLEVLESVVKKNGYDEEDWLLARNSSVLGKRLEATLEGIESFAEANTELSGRIRANTGCGVANTCLLVSRDQRTYFRYSRVMKEVVNFSRLRGAE